MKAPRTAGVPARLAHLHRAVTCMSSNPRTWRYLRDRDVQHAAAVTVLALVLSAGLIWLAYLVHVCRIAARSPLVPPRRMIALVFGRRLEGGAPEHDYQQRLGRTLTLAQHAQTDHVMLLGGCSGGQRSEASAGHAWLQRHGLPGHVRVELEQDSVDSLENLRHARRLLQADGADLPPVALVTSRYHLARCLLLARQLGFTGLPVAAESVLPRHAGYLGRLLIEAGYLMWIDLGLRWAHLIGHRRMAARLS
jgi:vancomycin permeability regulator SanA